MELTVVLIHLAIVIFLIVVVLLQRSEGGALGIGGGGGGLVTGRGAATALQKVTWGLGIGFIVTSLILTWMAAQRAETGSLMDPTPGIEAPVTDPVGPIAPIAPLAPLDPLAPAAPSE